MTGDLAYLYKALHDMFPDSTDNRPVTIAELDAVFKTAESLKINDMAAEKKVSNRGGVYL